MPRTTVSDLEREITILRTNQEDLTAAMHRLIKAVENDRGRQEYVDIARKILNQMSK